MSVLVFIQFVNCKKRITNPDLKDETIKEDSSFTVVGYLPDYRLAGIDVNVGKYADELVFFSIEPTSAGELKSDRFTSDVKIRLNMIKALNSTRLLIAIGGWDRSTGFATMSTNTEAREKFIQNLTAFCVDNDFDGADFDWEFPANLTEEMAYWKLLAEVKEAFKPYNLLVTVALNVYQKLNADAYRAVDHVHIMAYDQGGRHSTYEFAVEAVDKFMKQDVPPEKLFLGVPFYGRNMGNTNIAMTYADIVQNYHPYPNVDEIANFYFNGIETIKQKTHFALDKKIGGIMIWEVGQDTQDESSLLRAIYEVVTEGR